jgi:hypothetical protein
MLLDTSIKAIRGRYSSVTAVKRKARGDPVIKIKIDDYDRLRRDYDSLFRRKLTSLFKTSREEYFATLRATCLEN